LFLFFVLMLLRFSGSQLGLGPHTANEVRNDMGYAFTQLAVVGQIWG
jgi:hypothetical protein